MIEDLARQATGLADGAGRTWAFGFLYYSADHIVVETLVPDGVAWGTVSAADYTLAPGAGSAQDGYDGGTVTYPVAPEDPLPLGWQVRVSVTPPFLQENIDLTNTSGFDPKAVEREFDLAVLRDQSLRDRLGVLESGVEGLSNTIPTAKDAGATGDNTTDDTDALEVMFLTVGPYGTLWFPPGTYLVTDNITHFHTVQKFGPGIIRFGTETFAVEPDVDSIQHIWFGPDGDDDNMGLDPSNAVFTPQAAFDILGKYGYLLGSWSVRAVEAGTWTGDDASVAVYGLYSQELVVVYGVTVANNVQPTVIMDGTGAAAVHGWLFSTGMNIQIVGVDFRGWDSTTQASAVSVWDNSQLYLSNCWGSGNHFAVHGRQNSDINVQYGKWINNHTAIQFFSGCTFAVGTAATGVGTGPTDGPTISGNTYGIRAWEGCGGHFDYVTADGNDVAVFAQEMSKITVQGGGDFSNNLTVFRADINAEVSYATGVHDFHFDSADQNTVLSRQYSGGQVRITGGALQLTKWLDYVETDSTTVTGTTTETDLLSYTINAGTLCYGGAGVIVRVAGFFSGAGTKVIKVYLDNTEIFSHGLTTGGTGNFSLVFEVWHAGTDGGALQRNVGTIVETAASATGGTGTTKDMAQNNMVLEVRWVPGNSAGTVSTVLGTVERVG